jgi:RNA polymerase primary sigma factor
MLTEENKRVLDAAFSNNLDFVDNPIFYKPSEIKTLFQLPLSVHILDIEKSITYLFQNVDNTNSRTNIRLTKEDEKILFLRYNYARKRLYYYLRKYQENKLSEYSPALDWAKKLKESLDIIILVNIKLIIYVFSHKLHSIKPMDPDILAETIPAITGAAEKFDILKGFRFSTFCHNKIFWQLIKVIRQEKQYKRQSFQYKNDEDNSIKNNNFSYSPNKGKIDDVIDGRIIMEELVPKLNEKEQIVVIERIINGNQLKDASNIIGISQERVRQIEKKAVNKLREFVTNKRIELAVLV